MPAGFMPGLWAVLTSILGMFGVVWVPSDQVKTVCAGGVALIVAVWQWQHHKTARHADSLAAELGRERARRRADPGPDLGAGGSGPG